MWTALSTILIELMDSTIFVIVLQYTQLSNLFLGDYMPKRQLELVYNMMGEQKRFAYDLTVQS